MFAKLELTRMAQSMAAHAGARMGVIAQNIAHADTPGYKSRDLASFASLYTEQGQMRATRARHHFDSPHRPFTITTKFGSESPNGNDVSLELEMVNSAIARQDHEMALSIYRSTSGLIRASLGRNG